MNLLKTEGIVLQATPYREYDRIITLFTPQVGLLKLFAKGNKKNVLNPWVTPLVRGEYSYTAKTNLSLLNEGTLIASHHHLRDSLESLKTAAQWVQALLKTQSLGRPSPQLYALFALFLEKLPSNILHSCFLLKILKHEGLLQYEKGSTHRFGGEVFNETAMKGSCVFSEEEEKMIFFLAECRSFSTLTSFEISEEFNRKIESLFEQAVNY